MKKYKIFFTGIKKRKMLAAIIYESLRDEGLKIGRHKLEVFNLRYARHKTTTILEQKWISYLIKENSPLNKEKIAISNL